MIINKRLVHQLIGVEGKKRPEKFFLKIKKKNFQNFKKPGFFQNLFEKTQGLTRV